MVHARKERNSKYLGEMKVNLRKDRNKVAVACQAVKIKQKYQKNIN